MGVQIKPRKMLRRWKISPNPMSSSRLTTFMGEMLRPVAKMRIQADPEAMPATAMDAVSARIISVVIRTLFQAQISTAETKIDVMNAARALTGTVARRNQIR